MLNGCMIFYVIVQLKKKSCKGKIFVAKNKINHDFLLSFFYENFLYLLLFLGKISIMKVIILASVAELDVLGKDGRPVSCEHWQIVYVNGEETRSRNCTVNKNYDLQEGTFCQTVDNTAFPHQVVIDLGGI